MAKLKAESLFDLTFISDPQLSPDGKRAAAVHTVIESADEEDKPPRYVSHLFLYDTGTGEAVQVTHSGDTNTRPRFSPDASQLAFLSKRGGDEKAQLYTMPLTGGEARRLTDFKAGVSEFVWHPNGDIALVSRGDYEDARQKRGLPLTVKQMTYKFDGVGFLPSEPAQIYLYRFGKDKAKKLSKLKSNPRSLAFSPDGETLYFSGAKNPDEVDAWRSNIWRMPASGGKAKPLAENINMAFLPSPSPDGAHVAFFGPIDQEVFASPTGLWLVAAEGGEATLLTPDLEALPSIGGDSKYGALPNAPVWSEDSKTLFFNANREGRSGLTKLELDTRKLRQLHKEDRVMTSFAGVDGRFVFTAETPNEPGELFFRDGRGKETKLSSVNAAFLETYRITQASKPQRAKAKGGPRLTYWIMEPEKPRKDNALVLQVHGGPHTNYGYGFYFEFQLLASAGYTVVYGNPRGSSSYGADFGGAMLGGYGTVDADDVLAIARTAKKNHKDPGAPMHLTGGSYGGFMTNWLVGHTDEFRSAVTQRSISNWLSFYGTSDIGYKFSDIEVAGNPWEHTDKLWAQSPIKYVAEVNTPLLILHADEDHRCPVEQAEQLYIALKALGKETTFIRFPDEGHELSRSGRPDRRVARLEAILAWFEEHA